MLYQLKLDKREKDVTSVVRENIFLKCTKGKKVIAGVMLINFIITAKMIAV